MEYSIRNDAIPWQMSVSDILRFEVVLTNTQILIQSIANCEPFGNSDHLSVKFAINLANSSNTVNSKSKHLQVIKMKGR